MSWHLVVGTLSKNPTTKCHEIEEIKICERLVEGNLSKILHSELFDGTASHFGFQDIDFFSNSGKFEPPLIRLFLSCNSPKFLTYSSFKLFFKDKG